MNARIHIEDAAALGDVGAEGVANQAGAPEQLRENSHAEDEFQVVFDDPMGEEIIQELIFEPVIQQEQVVSHVDNTDSGDEELESLICDVKPFLKQYAESSIDGKSIFTLHTHPELNH